MKKQTLFVEVPVTRSKSFGSQPSLDKELEKTLSKNMLDDPDYELHNSSFNIDVGIESSDNPWDLAHHEMERLKKDKHEVSFIEPDIPQRLFDFQQKRHEKGTEPTSKAGPFSHMQYLNLWPQPLDVPFERRFVWHLEDNYSQLASARDWVMQQFPDRKIAIGHLDTGIQSKHPAMPPNFKGGRSFLPNEYVTDAEDKNVEYHLSLQGTIQYFQEQPGHGMATLAILAGGKLSKEHTNNQYEGYFGAIPQADIYCYRICDTVALFGTRAFAKAIHKAVDEDGCEVVSMSMAGGPSKRWAKAVNHAYMNGITVVTAAGNSWMKGSKMMTSLPKRLLFPARWERVIAATGATASHMPYLYNMLPGAKAEGGHFMQGNYGPKDVMSTAVAAYTPNTTWLTMNDVEKKGTYFSYQGGGTSSSTPQVAAAAGLWILANQEKLKKKGWNGSWKQVEAVKHALFSTAKKPDEYMEYLGNGIIQAKDALSHFPADSELRRSKEATVRFNGITDTISIMIGGFFAKSKSFTFGYQPNNEMLELELIQLLHSDPNLSHLLDYNLEDDSMKQQLSEKDFQGIKDAIIGSELASETLKKALK